MKLYTWIVASVLAGLLLVTGAGLLTVTAMIGYDQGMLARLGIGMGLVVLASVFGAIASITYLTPFERSWERERIALSRSEGMESSGGPTTPADT
jgi:membrane protein implicated in regulation of membrane protease activity